MKERKEAKNQNGKRKYEWGIQDGFLPLTSTARFDAQHRATMFTMWWEKAALTRRRGGKMVEYKVVVTACVRKLHEDMEIEWERGGKSLTEGVYGTDGSGLWGVTSTNGFSDCGRGVARTIRLTTSHGFLDTINLMLVALSVPHCALLCLLQRDLQTADTLNCRLKRWRKMRQIIPTWTYYLYTNNKTVVVTIITYLNIVK